MEGKTFPAKRGRHRNLPNNCPLSPWTRQSGTQHIWSLQRTKQARAYTHAGESQAASPATTWRRTERLDCWWMWTTASKLTTAASRASQTGDGWTEIRGPRPPSRGWTTDDGRVGLTMSSSRPARPVGPGGRRWRWGAWAGGKPLFALAR